VLSPGRARQGVDRQDAGIYTLDQFLNLESGGRVRLKLRQFLLTATLVTPLVFAIATAPPLVEETRAQGATHFLGPNFPAQITGSSNVVPQRTNGTTITVPTPWDCGLTGNNVFTLSNRDGLGRFQTASRNNGAHAQTITAGGFVNGSPRTFSIDDRVGGSISSAATVNLTDNNGDGVADSVVVTGSVNTAFSLVFSPSADAVSIPWSQASVLGIDDSTSCAGPLPQVWIPLADTNGDGRGDAVIFDLDGNGVADPDILPGPAVAPPSVPAMGPAARLILLTLISLVGAWFLSRRPHREFGTPAV
jgi:hypothetical protein